jgi:hypothetical protein
LKDPSRGEDSMSEKENIKPNEQESTPETSQIKKQQGRYTSEKKKAPEKRNKTETGTRQSRGKKQRRQFKLAPNRG